MLPYRSVFIVIIFLIIVTVQCCDNSFFNGIFFSHSLICPGLFENQLVLTQDLKLKRELIYFGCKEIYFTAYGGVV